jgi:hypothetical protein
MTGQRTTEGQRQALRARYLANPGRVSCTVCKEWMELLPPERDTIGVLWTWRCPRASEHPRLRHVDHHADLDVLAAVDDAERLTGALLEIARLRDALAFYADAHRYNYRPVGNGPWLEPSEVGQDRGKIARAALEPERS